MSSTISATSSSSSSSSSSLGFRDCACGDINRQPSPENILHFSGLGSPSFVKALLCNFPVLDSLSVIYKKDSHSTLGQAVIIVESLNILIKNKQLIVLVKNFQLPPTTCQTRVAAIVVLTQNTKIACSHVNNEIGHILYFHPERLVMEVAAIYLNTFFTSFLEGTLTFGLVLDYPSRHSVFGRLIEHGSGNVTCTAADSLLFVPSIWRSCPSPEHSSTSCLSNICTSLASSEVPEELSVNWARYDAIKKQILELPANASPSYLCAPIEPGFVEGIMAVTLLSRDIVHVIRGFYGCWWMVDELRR